MKKKPSALSPRDTIRVIAPSSSFEPARLHEASTWLENRGYKVKWDKGIFTKEDYLAGSDDRRFSEFEEAWGDPNTKAIFCARGGYGVTRFLDRLSVPKLKKQHKVFMGLSDLTVLLNFIASKTNEITVHGPVMAGDSFLGLEIEVRGKLFEKLENGEPTVLHDPQDYRVLVPGVAKGKLFGGNLAMIQSVIGTPFQIPFQGSILFLEEVNEARFRIDRMFCQLALAGVFKKIKGLVLGQFYDPEFVLHDLVWLKKIVERYVPSKIPVLGGLHAGHGRNNVWLPIGGICSIEKQGRQFSLPPLVQK